MSDFEFPKRGIVFWPIEAGDSTAVINEEAMLQVDPHLPSHDETSKKG